MWDFNFAKAVAEFMKIIDYIHIRCFSEKKVGSSVRIGEK